MNRRGFLRMLGTGAAVGGVAAVAPSQVWPFRKIFLPQFIRIDMLDPMSWGHLNYATYPGSVYTDGIANISYWIGPNGVVTYPSPSMRFEALDPTNKSHVKCAEAATKLFNMRNGNKILFEGAEITYLSAMKSSKLSVRSEELKRSFDSYLKGLDAQALHGAGFVDGDMSMENLNRSEVIAGSLNEKPVYKLRRAARKFVDSLKVRNEDLGWDG